MGIKESEEIKNTISIKLQQLGGRKKLTTITGIENTLSVTLTKQLKQKLSCGGTFKDGEIQLQGDGVEKVKNVLMEDERFKGFEFFVNGKLFLR